jgi:hypothetical protein
VCAPYALPLLSNSLREVNVMHVALSYAVKNECCYYNLHSRCEKGLDEPDPTICSECIADVLQKIVDSRKQLSIFAEAA